MTSVAENNNNKTKQGAGQCVPASAAAERALMQLYNATGGDRWRNNTGWGAAGEDPCCDGEWCVLRDWTLETLDTPTLFCSRGWYGVNCTADSGEVSVLALNENDLNGTLPSEWGGEQSMTALSELSLYSNPNLAGPLPCEWGEGLPTISAMDLDSNALTGSLPSEWGEGMKTISELLL